MIQLKKIAYNSLRNLSVRDRISAAESPRYGTLIMSALTPTELAQLFPRYYLQGRPNISGFLATIPSDVSRQRQKYYDEQFGRTVETDVDSGDSILTKLKRKVFGDTARPGAPPLPSLTPEQTAAYEKVMQGPLDVNSTEAKQFAGLTAEQLSSVGLQRYKDEQGHEFLKYTAPAVSPEEAKARIQTSAGKSNAFFDAIIRSEGSGVKGNPYDEVLGYGAYGRPSKRPSEMTVREWIEYQKGLAQRYAAATGKEPASAMGAFQIVGKTLQYRYKSAGLTLDSVMTPENQRKVAAEIYRAEGLGAWTSFRKHPGERAAAEEAAKQGLYQQTAEIPSGRMPTEQEIAKMQEQLLQEKNVERRQKLANVLAGIPGTPQYQQVQAGQAPGPALTSKATFGPGEMPRVIPDNTVGYCGVGTRHAAGQMFGDKYFINNGLGTGGGGSNAASLSGGNRYLQISGYYKNGRSITLDDMKNQSWLDSLPVGTVISAGGGNGDGHVQIKVGPHHWMSDHEQGDHVLIARNSRQSYNNFTVHEPNETGIALLNKRGFNQSVSPAATQDVVNSSSAAVRQSAPDSDVPGEKMSSADVNRQGEVAQARLTEQTQRGRSAVVQGRLTFEGGGVYHFGSGRPDDADHPSTPLGSSEVGALNPHHVPGGVGYEMPSLNNRFDPKVGRYREGMVIHSAGHDDLKSLYSHGCISIPKSEFPAFQKEMDDFKKAHGGKAYINIMPDGSVTVSAASAYDSSGNPMTPITPREAIKEIQTNQPQVVTSAEQVKTGEIEPLPSAPAQAAPSETTVYESPDKKESVKQRVTPTAPLPGTPGAATAAPTAAHPHAAAPEAKPAGVRYIFSKKDYLNDIARAHPMIDSMAAKMMGQDRDYAWSETVKGLREAEAAGVLKYNEKSGELVIKDMNHPRVQQILKDMKDNDLNQAAFLRKQEEKKQEETKKQTASAEATRQIKPLEPSAPTATPAPTNVTEEADKAAKEKESKRAKPVMQQVQPTAPVSGTPGAAPPAPAQAPAPSVPAKAEGGKVDVSNDQAISARPIGGLRGDNAVVVNQSQQPIFTMNVDKESAVYDPAQKKVDVVPQTKQESLRSSQNTVTGVEPTPRTAGEALDKISSMVGNAQANAPAMSMHQEFTQLADNLRSEFTSMVSDQSKTPMRPFVPTVSDRDPLFIDKLLDATRVSYRNPTSERAFSRARFVETGDASSDYHHSVGNSAQV